jgi:hypothetical protein
VRAPAHGRPQTQRGRGAAYQHLGRDPPIPNKQQAKQKRVPPAASQGQLNKQNLKPPLQVTESSLEPHQIGIDPRYRDLTCYNYRELRHFVGIVLNLK